MIDSTGRWSDCDVLTSLLLQRKTEQQQQQPIFVEAGVQIGCCLLQVLLTSSTNATIIAFEPNPRNLFRITSTLLNLPSENMLHWRDRVYLFPIALGKERAQATINTERGNAGNSVIDKQIRSNPARSQPFLPPETIHVERLDDILSPQLRRSIDLVKLDTQGFECYIVQGMQRTLQSTQAIHFEAERHFLNQFEGCSAKVLWNFFHQQNFTMYRALDGNKPLERLNALPSTPTFNAVAIRRQKPS